MHTRRQSALAMGISQFIILMVSMALTITLVMEEVSLQVMITTTIQDAVDEI